MGAQEEGRSILLEVSGPVATITLNRPEARNRLDLQGIAQVQAAIEAAIADPQVRVIVITGTGSTFCAGADLAGATEGESGFATSALHALGNLLASIADCPKPTIARVQGHVAGGGNGLVAACDVAVATAEARFAFSEVRIGVAPAVISVLCLQVMHRRHAQELMLTGDRVSAERAMQAGLLTHVAEEGSLDAIIASYVEQFASCGPQALSLTKELIRRVPSMPRDEAFEWTAQVSAQAFTSAEAQEGMRAFLERRPASWATPNEGSTGSGGLGGPA